MDGMLRTQEFLGSIARTSVERKTLRANLKYLKTLGPDTTCSTACFPFARCLHTYPKHDQVFPSKNSSVL